MKCLDHKVTMDECRKSLDECVLICSQAIAGVGHKEITYNPLSEMYTISRDGEEVSSQVLLVNAVDIYNGTI